MRSTITLIFLISSFTLLANESSHRAGEEELEAQLGEGVYDKVREVFCILKNKHEKTDIVALIVDDNETFCGPTNFKMFAKTLDVIPEVSNDQYIEGLAKLLYDEDDLSKKLLETRDPHVRQVFGSVVHFYRTPYKKLTLVIEMDGKLENRTIEK